VLLQHDKPTDAPVPVNSKRLPAGVLVDSATMKRIPFPRKVDMETGEVEYLVPAANGVDVLIDPYTQQPYIRRYKAIGKLVLEPMAKADRLGVAPPKKVVSEIQPMTPEEKVEGLNQYKRLYFQVWNGIRGEAAKCVNDRFADYLKTNHFLDSFLFPQLQRTAVRIHTS